MPWIVLVLTPLTAAERSSESMVLAVPGSPTSIRPLLPARVTMQRSTSASLPKYFFSMVYSFPLYKTGFALPRMKVRTALGDICQFSGRLAVSLAFNASSSSRYRTSTGGFMYCSIVSASCSAILPHRPGPFPCRPAECLG